jgi:Family of unknown function (DUF6483)
MIRRDYILGMIEEFFQALARIKSQKSAQQWREAEASVDQEFQRLLGAGAEAAAQTSETELLARTVHGEPTLAVREKILIVATLLKEAGEVFTEQGRQTEGRTCFVRGLHLLLDTFGRGEVFECPQFVPKVEEFIIALGGSDLPLETQGRLMQHYERTGEFARAEDALFAMLEAEPDHVPLLELGISFYHRLESESDAHLADGNLPRVEVEAGLADLKARKEALCRTA